MHRRSYSGQCPRRLTQTVSTKPRFASLQRPAFVVAVVGVLLTAAASTAALADEAAARAGVDDAVPSHLTIASEGARPPYNYWDGDKLAGFEIDLGRDLCRRMKTQCTFIAHDWDTMIRDLKTHRYDAVMAAMEVVPWRSAQIAFSTPYVRMPSAFLARKSTTIAGASPKSLAGVRIGVEANGPHEAFLAARYPEAVIKRYATLSDAILDLEAGRVDAALGDKDAIVAFLHDRRDAACCKILADVPRDPKFFGAGVAIGLRKDDPALRAAFDKALSEAKADGTFAAISARYFSFPID